jgi:ribonuclease P protein subunit POP4
MVEKKGRVHPALKRELIGLRVEIVSSANSSLVGVSGKVLDETRNSFVLETKDGVKRILKNPSRFMFHIGKDCFEVDGSRIARRPEDRISKVR